jgi:hypothetical protein
MASVCLRRALSTLVLLGASLPLLAETVTLPVAASLTGVGGAPFVSDVRVFNTSYTQALSVTVRYRPAANAPDPQAFSLAPREGRAFDDMVGVFFTRPGTLGAVEFEHAGANGALVAVSQLGSPQGAGKVGMFIPGRRGAGDLVSALVGLSNGASRTNVGIYNPNGSSVTAVVKLYQGVVELGRTTQTVGANQTVQFNVYNAVNQGGHVTTTGHAVVEASDEVFTYAAQADNATNDTILIVGERDIPQPAGFVFPQPTPSVPPAGARVEVSVGSGRFSPGTMTPIVVTAGVTTTLHFEADESRHGFSGIPALGIAGTNNISSGEPDDGYGGGTNPVDYDVTFTAPASARGQTFPFSCTVETCGPNHSTMLGTLRVD